MAGPSDNPEPGMAGATAALAKPRTLATRPEQGFEKRRRIFFMSLVAVVVAGGLFIFQRCSTPVNVAPMFGGQPAAAAQPISLGGAAVVTPLRAVAPPVVVAPTPTSGVVNGGLDCWAIADFQTRAGLIPAEAEVRVYGFTNAKGGMVLVGTDWVSTSYVRCNGNVADLERPFVIDATPTREPRAAAVVAAATPNTIYIYPTPGATAVPIVQEATPVNGLWTSGLNCWTINVQGVSQIWVNGKAATTGTYCGVTDLHIVAGVQQ